MLILYILSPNDKEKNPKQTTITVIAGSDQEMTDYQYHARKE